MGRLLFYILWPLVWMYSPIFRRVRIVIMYKDQFVAVKNTFGPGTWQLPGGGIKFGESVEVAAIREAQEELDMIIKKVHIMHDEVLIVKQFGLLMRYHFVYVDLKEKAPLIKNYELKDAVWMSITNKKHISNEIKEGLKLADKQG